MSESLFPRVPHFREKPNWTINDSRFESYLHDFARVDRDRKIPALLKRLQGVAEPVVIDLMASRATLETSPLYHHPGARLFAVGADPDIPSLSLTKPPHKVRYIRKNLNIQDSLDEIEDNLEGSKAHLIMERAYGGLHYIPTELNFQRGALRKLWNMLDSDGGLLVLQTPPLRILEERGIPMQLWLQELRKAGIYYQFLEEFTSLDPNVPYGMLLLEKNSSAVRLPDVGKLIFPYTTTNLKDVA